MKFFKEKKHSFDFYSKNFLLIFQKKKYHK